MRRSRLAVAAVVAAACGAAFTVSWRHADGAEPKSTAAAPVPGAASADSLIREGEHHLAYLWQLTFGGEKAEAYWS